MYSLGYMFLFCPNIRIYEKKYLGSNTGYNLHASNFWYNRFVNMLQ
jgi:hypothetical protein